MYNWTPLPVGLIHIKKDPGNGYVIESENFRKAGALIRADLSLTPEWDRTGYPDGIETGLVNQLIATDLPAFMQEVVREILEDPTYTLPFVVQNRRIMFARDSFGMNHRVSSLAYINRT